MADPMADSRQTGSVPPCALVLPEQVNVNNVVAVMASLEGECKAQRQSSASCCSVDLSRLRDFDSTVLSMLLEMGRHAGKPLAVIDLPAKLVSLAGLYGVSELLLSAPAAEGCA